MTEGTDSANRDIVERFFSMSQTAATRRREVARR